MANFVYIHIPFCDKICTYCDFAKVITKDSFIEDYLIALENEIKIRYKNEKIKTLYFGGGTPSALNIEQLKKLFKICEIFFKDENIEITFEGNVESFDLEKLKYLKSQVNRISIGVQTFDEKTRISLNRHYSNEQIYEVVKNCKKVGFTNISVDLMFHFKNQTLENLENDLENFLKLDIDHISMYSLIPEENTKLFIRNDYSKDEDLEADMFEKVIKTLKENGFEHYEISNFAKSQKYSVNNLCYWSLDDYYGFGLGSGSLINNQRIYNTKRLSHYLQKNYILNIEKLSLNEQMSEFCILGLRKIKGFSYIEFNKRFKIDFFEKFKIDKLIKEELLIIEKEYVFLSAKGLLLGNNVFEYFLNE